MKFNHVNSVKFQKLDKVEGPSGRFYITPEGFHYPSITTILGATADKSGLIAWRNAVGEREAERVSRSAAGRGTRIHKYLEDYLDNKEVSGLSYIDKPQFDSITPVLDKYVNNIWSQESHLYSHHLKLAGQVDCIAEFLSKLAVIDFKTSKRIKDRSEITDYFLQSTFYALAFQELTGVKISYIVILIIVDFDKPQIFVEKVSDYMDLLIKRRKSYE